MLSISPQQMKQMADERRRRMEDAWILKELRDAYGSVLVALDDGFLRSEITACLARCDELGLHSSKDRLSFCFIDIGFSGLQVPAQAARTHRQMPGDRPGFQRDHARASAYRPGRLLGRPAGSHPA
jgi:hypothetical protein